MKKKTIRILKRISLLIVSVLIIIVILLLVAIPFSLNDGPSVNWVGDKKESFILQNVNIIDVESNNDTDAIWEDRTVVVTKGRITEILPDSISTSLPYEKINAKGKYLLPGLIDMHTHIFDRSDLAMYLAYGVTTVRNMMGFPMHLRWRDQVNSALYPGARLITASPTLNGGTNTSPFHKNINAAEEAMDAVKEYKRLGYDFIKVYDGLNKDEFAAIMDEASKNDLYVAGHPPHALNLDVILNSNLNSIEHVEELIQGPMKYELDTVLGRKIIKQFKKQEARLTVTLSPFYAIFKATTEGEEFLSKIPKDKINPFIRFIGNKQLSQWIDTNEGAYTWNTEKYECMRSLVKILDEEDVELLLGTDTGPSLTIPGITLHDEIKLLEKNGLSPLKILQSGTISAANALNMYNDIGSITIGKQAEFLLLHENPLENLETLKSPYIIISKDKVYGAKDIQELKELGSEKTNMYLTIGRFLDHLINK